MDDICFLKIGVTLQKGVSGNSNFTVVRVLHGN